MNSGPAGVRANQNVALTEAEREAREVCSNATFHGQDPNVTTDGYCDCALPETIWRHVAVAQAFLALASEQDVIDAALKAFLDNLYASNPRFAAAIDALHHHLEQQHSLPAGGGND